MSDTNVVGRRRGIYWVVRGSWEVAIGRLNLCRWKRCCYQSGGEILGSYVGGGRSWYKREKLMTWRRGRGRVALPVASRALVFGHLREGGNVD